MFTLESVLEKTNIDSLLKFLRNEHAQFLLTQHCFTGCDTIEKFHNVSNESWIKSFLQIKDQDYFKVFESLQEDVMPKTIEHFTKFVCWDYINRAKHPNLTTLAEVLVHLFKQINASCEKTPPTNHGLIL